MFSPINDERKHSDETCQVPIVADYGLDNLDFNEIYIQSSVNWI